MNKLKLKENKQANKQTNKGKEKKPGKLTTVGKQVIKKLVLDVMYSSAWSTEASLFSSFCGIFGAQPKNWDEVR